MSNEELGFSFVEKVVKIIAFSEVPVFFCSTMYVWCNVFSEAVVKNSASVKQFQNFAKYFLQH